MYIVSIVGSPRRGSTTDLLIDKTLKGAKDSGAEVEKIYINDLKFAPCEGCMKCRANCECRLPADDVDMIVEKLDRADGIILGAPVYMGHVPGTLKSLFDRLVGRVIKFDLRGGNVNITSALTKKKRNGVAIGVCAAKVPGMTNETIAFLKRNILLHINGGAVQEINAEGMAAYGQVKMDNKKLESIFGTQGKVVYENCQLLLKQAYDSGKKLVTG